jgi:hypothetical protein
MIEKFEDNLKPNFISDKKLFTKIWTSPREVFQFLNTYKYDKHTTILLILAGIARSFDRASSKNMGNDFSIWGIIAFCIIGGALFGWITYYLYAALISWTGKWLNGRGNTDSILRVLSFALLPSIVSLVFLIPQMLVYGTEIFKSEGDISSEGIISNLIVYSSIVLELILGFWTFVLCIIAISEVQQLSIGKSILNVLLPAIIFVAIIFIIVLIVSGFN